jgi:hypothetical protein
MRFKPSHFAVVASAAALILAAFLAVNPRLLRAQEQIEDEITATTRLFPDIGPGIRAIKRDAHGRYYFLSTVDHSVRVYTGDNTFVGQIPRSDSGPAAITYGYDMDLDASGNIYVADRAANKVKVYTPDGKLSLAISVAAPTSVAAIGSDIAVTSLKSRDLITIYDAQGKYVREFGDMSDLAEHEDFNRFLNIGRLATDPANHVYYAFTYSPEPTVRKYDAYGYSAYQISLHTLDIYPNAQAQRRNIARIDLQSSPQPIPAVINAIGVDPQTQEVWLAIGDVLMKFDKSGNRVASYQTLTNSSEDLHATAILVESDRILLADDPHGIFAFARPDHPATPTAKAKE